MNARYARIGIVAVGLAGFVACASYEAAPTSSERSKATEKEEDRGLAPGGGAAQPEALAPPPGAKGRPSESGGRMAAIGYVGGLGDDAEPAVAAPEEPAKDGSDDGGDVRQWFPEAFLWAPLVETDASGTATVEVRVPDSLTTWRVLALAHSRDGRQAGAVHTFDSRLDLYVEPVVPGWLYAGDAVELPIQLVNTTKDPLTAELVVTASGALGGAARQSLTLGAFDSDVRRVVLATTGAGPARVKAVLGTADAAEREIPVVPAGRPVAKVRGGSLSSPRTFRIGSPEGADPATQELSVVVFPGPLAVLQAEVARGGSAGQSAADAAYGFALAHQLQVLSGRAGLEADTKAVRTLQLLAWQRVVRHSRSPDAGVAADLLVGMRDVEGHALAEELAARLVDSVVSGQRADGSWARQDIGSLQLVIAQTAFAGRALPPTEEGARLRASGAIERYARDVKDPYTAAVVLASGLADGDTASHLRTVLAEGIVTHADGSRSVEVPPGVQNPWGARPSKAEMLAWTVLASDDAVVRGDLVSELMSGWSARWGFGAAAADALALEAVLTTLPGLDRPVEVVLTLDGREVARQSLDPSQPKVPALLVAAPRGIDAEIGLSVEPQVPGLAFVATLASWVPWSGAESLAGVDVEVTAQPMRVGRDADVVLTLSAPSGVSLVVEQGLPAGASVDALALEALAPLIQDVEVRTDRVRFRTRSFAAGEVIEVPITVRPAFSGTFSTAPLTVEAVGQGSEPVSLPPLTWTVAG